MQLMSLIEKTMRKYDTGYEDIFWTVESDGLHNY